MIPLQQSHSPALGPGSAGPPLALPYASSFDQVARPHAHQPSCGAATLAVDPAAVAGSGDPRKHTQTPYVTGTSVLGLTYKDGVILASDTLGSYGSTKRYKAFERLVRVNDAIVLGASGELSDFQYLQTLLRGCAALSRGELSGFLYLQALLEELTTEDYCMDDGHMLSPRECFAYLSRVLYNRRNKFDPLWNSLVVGGLQNGVPFLGTVGMIGTHYADAHIATGFGNYLARPLFRERHRPDMSEAEAEELIKEGLKVCYYRDKQSINKFQIAKVTKDGVTISDPFAIETMWEYKHFVDPSVHAAGTW